ncbi:MAG: 1,4-alpha-glucan branching protein GlgB [Helicobacteraceae bacterium]|jgi:1,4-alpha-glucan branching enzyme|nr:1,4-alpha-glucan branching protein GlgB [Helicobacteraceae bacterium]
MIAAPAEYDFSLWGEQDSYYFKSGTHYRLFEILGSHIVTKNRVRGAYFAIWAPNASHVSVIADFNGYDGGKHPLKLRGDGSGVWEGFIAGAKEGDSYKYLITAQDGTQMQKSDPYGSLWEVPPKSATRIHRFDYVWNDEEWLKERSGRNKLDAPMSIYEMHLGSWRFNTEEGRALTYRELGGELPKYLNDMGYTHVEFLPPTEYPFDGSWGYQCIGYFAPTSRYGAPEDFAFMVDCLHQAGIGIFIDWVPSHFAVDMHGLANFDGTNLYEHTDPRQGFHPQWGSAIFNHGRNEVKAFLISSAIFWLDRFHIDGIRVDAVASMLYLDYGRKEGEWIPNEHGGKENLKSVQFLQTLNAVAYEKFPDIAMIAEESTAWPMVTRPTYLGGLGFGLKWNMGWMHDTLKYFSRDPLFRSYNHDQITFSIWYAFHENFLLSLSHDEVVHMKGSLIGRMPGDEWQRFANLRLLFTYMFAHPGKKLMFMGMEFGQYAEWNYKQSLDWHLLQYPVHSSLQRFIADLNRFYRSQKTLWLRDFTLDGFEWADMRDGAQSVIGFFRYGGGETLLILCNFTPVVRRGYRMGVNEDGEWLELFNSDSAIYGGGNTGNCGKVEAEARRSHGREYSLSVTLPPLGAVIFGKKEGNV